MATQKPDLDKFGVKAFQKLTPKGIERAWRGLKAKHQRLSIKGYSDEIGINNQTLRSILDGNRAQPVKIDALEEYIGYTFGLDERVPDESNEQKDSPKGGAERHNSVFLAPRRNTLCFTGREELLTELAQLLETKQPVALSGLAGIGKTHIATEYAHRYRDRYNQVLWINAATLENLDASLANLAFDLDLTDADKKLTERRLKKYFREQQGWLLVIDNADNLRLVQEWLSLADYGNILLTTRDQETRPLATCMRIDKMTSEESSLFLLRRSGVLTQDQSLEDASEENRQCTEEINVFLDGFPLALDQAGAYILETPSTLNEYLALYQREYERIEKNRLLEQRGRNALDHKESVTITYFLILEVLEKRSPKVVELLNLCAFLASDDIPERLFMYFTGFDAYRFNEFFNEAARFSLIPRNIEKETLGIHRLVQEIIRDSIDDEEQICSIWVLLRMVAVYFSSGVKVSGIHLVLLIPHIITLNTYRRQFGDKFNLFDKEIAYFLLEVASIIQEFDYHEEAEAIYSDLWLSIDRNEIMFLEGYDLVSFNDSVTENLTNLYANIGRYGVAKMLCAFFMAIYERSQGKSSYDTLNRMMDLGDIYKSNEQEREYEIICNTIISRIVPLTPEEIGVAFASINPRHPNFGPIIKFWLRLSMICLDQNRSEEAKSILTWSSLFIEEVHDIDVRFQYFQARINLFIKHEEYIKAEVVCHQAIKELENHEISPKHLTAVKMLTTIYDYQDKYESALHASIMASSIAHTLYSEENPTIENILALILYHIDKCLTFSNLDSLYFPEEDLRIPLPALRAKLEERQVNNTYQSFMYKDILIDDFSSETIVEMETQLFGDGINLRWLYDQLIKYYSMRETPRSFLSILKGFNIWIEDRDVDSSHPNPIGERQDFDFRSNYNFDINFLVETINELRALRRNHEDLNED